MMRKRVHDAVVVTHLTMESPCDAYRTPSPRGVSIRRAHKPPLHFYRYLYHAVGRNHAWTDRVNTSDADLASVVHNSQVRVNVLYVHGAPAGFAELDFRRRKEATLTLFGLIHDFIGHGLGRYFLRETVEEAWDEPISLLRVSTCTLDHRHALPLYQKMGFRASARETITVVEPVTYSPFFD